MVCTFSKHVNRDAHGFTRSPGLQISLNYLMKFNAELTSNSSRDYLGGMGVMTGCDLACAKIYKDSFILLLPGLCKPGRAWFWRSNSKSATWLAQAGSHFFD